MNTNIKTAHALARGPGLCGRFTLPPGRSPAENKLGVDVIIFKNPARSALVPTVYLRQSLLCASESTKDERQ